MTWSREALEKEIQEQQADLKAFKEARSVIHQRLLDIEGTPHHELLADWAGTQVLMNAFVMVITRQEGLIQDMYENLKKMDAQTVIRLVHGGKDDE